jgi:shikimate kinase
MKIILLGYMGCGKSTIARCLAKSKRVNFIDLDYYIEEKEQLSIKEIFSTKGEIYVRLQESIYLKEIIETKDNYILSLGGGTPCYANNMNTLLESKILSIYLRANIPTLVNRLEKEKSSRPLIADLTEEKLIEYIGKHLFERAPFYEQSNFKINVNGKSVLEIATEIEAVLH